MKKYYITDDEIQQAKTMLIEKGVGWINGKYHEPTNEQDADLLWELSAMGMIHSFIAYRPLSKKDEWIKDRYFKDHLKNLGAKKLQALIDRAIERVEHIGYAGTDGEGCTYNGIRWKAEC
jgi:hypothetical protein